MNKLLLKPQIYIEKDGAYNLEGKSSKVDIFVLPNVRCDLLITGEEIDANISIHVLENAKLRYQSFFLNVSSHVEIFLEEYASSVEFIFSMIATKKCGLEVSVHHDAKRTTSKFYNSIVNYGDDLASIQVDAYVPKGVSGCHLTQDNKIILIQDGKGKILPNLWIDEYDCFAEHAAYVSKFSKEDLFYLMMRGISEDDAYFLLTKSLLLGKLRVEDEKKMKFTEIIQKTRR